MEILKGAACMFHLNHAPIYSRQLERAICFVAGLLDQRAMACILFELITGRNRLREVKLLRT
ncbi:hypothetical protein [Cupriavidus sp. USMAHM13]|uniref:hypothetical protein n=1 Tax=Cupriavidus sp. USMAHM13 TaxID=1389192 RepID=UPI0012E9F8E8|nr:hypothetical protein [Cupriavidus sp. USMAHM13]